MKLMSNMSVAVTLDLMEFIEFKFIVWVVVVNLFSESVAICWLVGSLLLAHQQL